ncbi:MAG: hypothetical protein N2442_08220 [Spirochaetes bacterium]|nr:hypothetical protein [Spirochaetota bacterium]
MSTNAIHESPSIADTDIDTRVAQARLRALEAARCNCALLRTQLNQLRGRMTSIRSKSSPLSYIESTPSYFDIDI